MNKELGKKIYDAFFTDNASFRSKFPTFDSFLAGLEDPASRDDLIKKTYGAFTADNAQFRAKYPTINSYMTDFGVGKYTKDQLEVAKETAMTGIQKLYQGDWEKLIANRNKLKQLHADAEGILQKMSGTESSYPTVSAKVRNLARAVAMVNAYEDIQNAKSDVDFESLINSDNPFIKMAMPAAEYRALELGTEPSTSQILFPEATRREGVVGTAIGGAKDILRLPGRALRPVIEDIAGVRNPALSYTEEFARPEKYKTSAQTMFDELIGIQGLGGGAARAVGTRAVMALPNVARGVNKVAPFINPAETIIGRVGGAAQATSYPARALWNVGKELPSIGLDVGYEMTKPSDEEAYPVSALLGGIGGAAIAPKIGDLIQGGLAKTPFVRTELQKELLSGSPIALNEELQMARAMMSQADQISTGGRAQLQDLRAGLREARGIMANERADVAKEFNNQQKREEFRNILRSISTDPRLRDLGYDPMQDLKPETKEFILQPRMYDFRNDPSVVYLEEIAKAHPSKRAQLISEIENENGVTLPNKDLMDYVANKLVNDNKLKSMDIVIKVNEAPDAASAYKAIMDHIAENPKDFTNLEAFNQSNFEPFDVTKAIEARTKFREYGEGEGPYGTQRGLFEQAETVQKNVMDKILSSSPEGKVVQQKYADLARTYDLEDQLPDLNDGQAVDNFLGRIGASRMNIASKASFFDDMLKFQNQINATTGRDIDFITPAVLRRIQNKSFWNDYLGDKAGAAEKAWEIAKGITTESLTAGKIRSIASEATKAVARGEGTDVQKRQKAGGPKLGALGGDDGLLYEMSPEDRQWFMDMYKQRGQEWLLNEPNRSNILGGGQ